MEEHEDVLASWVSEYAYCPRRFYIKIEEQKQLVNEAMAKGIAEHQRVDKEQIERRRDVVKATRLPVRSDALGLYGICDMVEFRHNQNGAFIEFLNDRYSVIPIEYKHGKKRALLAYEEQLTAQAMCLEEMYSTKINEGFIYYTSSREKMSVLITKELKEKTVNTISGIRRTITGKEGPVKPVYQKRCLHCSVYDYCMPQNQMTERYLQRLWFLAGERSK